MRHKTLLRLSERGYQAVCGRCGWISQVTDKQELARQWGRLHELRPGGLS